MLSRGPSLPVAALGAILLAGLVVWLQASSRPAVDLRAAAEARSVRFTYAVTLHDLPPDADSVRAWIPVPREHAFQAVESYGLAERYASEMVEEETFGNRFLELDLTPDARSSPGSPLTATVEATVTRFAYQAWDRRHSPNTRAENLTRYLQPNRLVPIDGFIAEEARRVVGNAGSPLEKARRLYDHVVSTLAYSKEGEGWGNGDAVYACDVRSGNCTDFHSLFIAEARAVGVPARFVIGFPLPADRAEGAVEGYHCWSEFWLDGYGWVPVDASEAHKRPQLHEFFFGGLDADRVEFTVGRDLDLPRAAIEDLNFIIYPHVEVDGELHQSVETVFRFRSTTAAPERTTPAS